MTFFVLIFGQYPKKYPQPQMRDPIYRYIIKHDVENFYQKIKGFRKDFEKEVGGYENAIKLVTLLMKMMHQDPQKRTPLNEVISTINEIAFPHASAENQF
ncbi:hypothetical protein ABPG74_015848 [Tetrahymena malaccensis]